MSNDQPGTQRDPDEPGSGQPRSDEQPQSGGQPGSGQQYGGQPGYGPQYGVERRHGYPSGMSPSDERTWAMLAHLGALLVTLVTGLLGFVVPLIIMSSKGNVSRFVRQHAVASLNFQLTVLLVSLVGGILGVVFSVVTLGFGVLLFLPAAAAYGIFVLVVMIIASVRANNGEDYRYPLSFRFVS